MEDEYVVEEEDYSEDDYESSSSEDEIQNFIKQECGLLEVEDDFEAEVDRAMTAHIRKLKSLEVDHNETSTAGNSSGKADSTTADDTDPEKINDDLLYDPKMDDEDEKWINDMRRSYIFPSENKNRQLKPLPNSDAVLNCPACLTLLCLDCQRHETYKSQYRAMFVTNCNVISDEILKYPNKKKKPKKSASNFHATKEETYNPVRCSVCNTEVAVYDTDEIYHFFNVLSSY